MAEPLFPDQDSRAPEKSLPEPSEAELRQVAIARLKTKRDFRGHLLVYVVVNIGFWTLWIADGVSNGWGFPWPVFPTVFWGLFVLGGARDLYGKDSFREDHVQREIEQLRSTRPSRYDR